MTQTIGSETPETMTDATAMGAEAAKEGWIAPLRRVLTRDGVHLPTGEYGQVRILSGLPNLNTAVSDVIATCPPVSKIRVISTDLLYNSDIKPFENFITTSAYIRKYQKIFQDTVPLMMQLRCNISVISPSHDEIIDLLKDFDPDIITSPTINQLMESSIRSLEKHLKSVEAGTEDSSTADADAFLPALASLADMAASMTVPIRFYVAARSLTTRMLLSSPSLDDQFIAAFRSLHQGPKANGMPRQTPVPAEPESKPSPETRIRDDGTPSSLEQTPGIRRIRGRLERVIERSRQFTAGKEGRLPGLILEGPPGTGKTMMAKVIARETGRNLIVTSFAEWQSSKDGHLGSTLKAMRNTFADARASRPSLVFLDEMDSLGSRGSLSMYDDYWTAVINCFLEQVSGSTPLGDVMLIGATNHKDKLDPAILREGRFGEHIYIPEPDRQDIQELLAYFLKPHRHEVDVHAWSWRLTGTKPAEIKAIVSEASYGATSRERVITNKELMRGVEAVAGRSEAVTAFLKSDSETERRLAWLAGTIFGSWIAYGESSRPAAVSSWPGLGGNGTVGVDIPDGGIEDTALRHAADLLAGMGGYAATISLLGAPEVSSMRTQGALQRCQRFASELVKMGFLPGRMASFGYLTITLSVGTPETRQGPGRDSMAENSCPGSNEWMLWGFSTMLRHCMENESTLWRLMEMIDRAGDDGLYGDILASAIRETGLHDIRPVAVRKALETSSKNVLRQIRASTPTS